MTRRMLANGYRGNPDSFKKMIFFSVAAHFIAISLILVSVPTHSRRLTFGPIYSVQLVGSEAVLPSDNASSFNDLFKMKDVGQTIILKRKITSMYSDALQHPADRESDIQKALNAIRQRQNITTPAAPPSANATGSAATAGEMNSEINNYIQAVWFKVKQNWSVPPSLMPDDNITAIIGLSIDRNGAVEKVFFEKRSGNRYFDESALKAVKKSQPFPPLPRWVRDNTIEIGIRFHSADLR
jgi:TonB family protein